jgi:hypothetical protein
VFPFYLFYSYTTGNSLLHYWKFTAKVFPFYLFYSYILCHIISTNSPPRCSLSICWTHTYYVTSSALIHHQGVPFLFVLLLHYWKSNTFNSPRCSLMPTTSHHHTYCVTSSYILCHIIIHTMSHHHTCYVTPYRTPTIRSNSLNVILCHIIIHTMSHHHTCYVTPYLTPTIHSNSLNVIHLHRINSMYDCWPSVVIHWM